MTMLKGWRTLAFNALALVVMLADMREVVDAIPSDMEPWFALAVAVANIGLRYVTTTPVGRKA